MTRTEQEEKLEVIFNGLEAAFKKLEKTRDEAKRGAMLKDITAQLRDSKTLIKEFEREARIDGMPARELADRKRELVNELNSYIALKKNYAGADEARGELMAGAAAAGGGAGGGAGAAAAGQQQGSPYDGMSMQELVKEGRKGMHETEAALGRAEKLVEDTLQIGTQTAATLHDQTQQLNKVVDDLNEIEFTMKKATRVIADITKGIMTDKCIMFLLFLVVAGVIALVIVKVINPHKKQIAETAANLGINSTQITEQISSGLQTAGQQVASGLSSGVAAVTKGLTGGGGGGSGGSEGHAAGGGATRRRLFAHMFYGAQMSGGTSSGTSNGGAVPVVFL